MRKYVLTTALLATLFAGKALAQVDNNDNGGETKLPTGIHMNDESHPAKPRTYSVLSAAPMQFTEIGIGSGISFEHSIDKNGIVTYVIPAVITFADDVDRYGNHQYNPMFYVMPGLKFYPYTCYGKVRYALGPSLVAGYGMQQDYNSNLYYNTQQYDKAVLGIMFNNSVNFNPTRHLYFGIEIGLGFTYINRLDGKNQGVSGISQGNLKMGYRF